MRDRLVFALWTVRVRCRVAWERWRTRNMVIISPYDHGRIFWRVSEPMSVRAIYDNFWRA